MSPKNGLYLITNIHFSAALVIFLKAKKYHTGNDWYAGMQ